MADPPAAAPRYGLLTPPLWLCQAASKRRTPRFGPESPPLSRPPPSLRFRQIAAVSTPATAASRLVPLQAADPGHLPRPCRRGRASSLVDPPLLPQGTTPVAGSLLPLSRTSPSGRYLCHGPPVRFHLIAPSPSCHRTAVVNQPLPRRVTPPPLSRPRIEPTHQPAGRVVPAAVPQRVAACFSRRYSCGHPPGSLPRLATGVYGRPCARVAPGRPSPC